jgi:tripartite-type tricarboxylate transporter receptor subunit TctC
MTPAPSAPVAVTFLLLAFVPGAGAQTPYPAKPVRIIVPFPPGGPTDVVTRTIGPRLSEALGQPVIIDNRAGAGGMAGTEQASKAPADGYTLLMGTIGGLAVAMSLQPNRGYDTLRDLAPITQSVHVTNIMAVHPSVPARSVKDLLAIARAQPGKLNYGSSGPGTGPHLAGELLKLTAKVSIVHVPYKGSAPALTALMGGEVDINFENTLIVLPHLEAGRVRPLAVTGANRSRLLPDLPTIGETIPGYSASGWYGLMAPAGTPRDILQRLNAEVVRILRMPDVIERLSGQGAEPAGGTREEFGAFLRAEIEKWARLVKAAGMRPD